MYLKKSQIWHCCTSEDCSINEGSSVIGANIIRLKLESSRDGIDCHVAMEQGSIKSQENQPGVQKKQKKQSNNQTNDKLVSKNNTRRYLRLQSEVQKSKNARSNLEAELVVLVKNLGLCSTRKF
jgi:hypothetical protein